MVFDMIKRTICGIPFIGNKIKWCEMHVPQPVWIGVPQPYNVPLTAPGFRTTVTFRLFNPSKRAHVKVKVSLGGNTAYFQLLDGDVDVQNGTYAWLAPGEIKPFVLVWQPGKYLKYPIECRVRCSTMPFHRSIPDFLVYGRTTPDPNIF